MSPSVQSQVAWVALGHFRWIHHVMETVDTVAACSSLVNMRCSMMDSLRVPLAVVVILLELKVEATPRFGRWLWGLSPKVLEFLQ